MTAVAPQLAKFVAVGGSNTLLSLAAFAVLAAAGVPYLAAAALAFALGAANGFLLNRRWTFRASGFASVPRYVAVQAAGLAATDGLVWLLAHGGAGRVVAYALSIPPVTLATFAANRAWAFRRASRP